MAALDDNGDGELSGEELNGLAIWQAKNGNGVTEPGEVPVAAHGITAISVEYQTHENGDTVQSDGAAFLRWLNAADVRLDCEDGWEPRRN